MEALLGVTLLLFIGNGLLATIPASIASGKGRSFGLWWVYGFLLFLVAVIHALLAEDAGRIPCPRCAERIRPEASICPHCRSDVGQTRLAPTNELVHGDEPELLPRLRPTTSLDDMLVLRFIAEAEGDLTAVGRRLDSDISEPVERLIADGHLVAEDWDRVAVTDEARALLDTVPVPEPGPVPVPGAGVHHNGGTADGGWRDEPGTRAVRFGSRVAYWNDEFFGFGDSADVVDLTDVTSVAADSGIADAWLVFSRTVGPEMTVPIRKAALDDARLVVAELNESLSRRSGEAPTA